MKQIDVNLKTLPKEHHLRNLPLIDVGAMYLPMDSKIWALVRDNYGIAKHSFNHLGDSWTMWDMWRATIDPYDCEKPNKTEW
jgi:hypothetical protein